MRTVWWVFTSKDVFCSEMKSRERPKLQGLFVQPSIRAVTVECLSLVTLVISNDFFNAGHLVHRCLWSRLVVRNRNFRTKSAENEAGMEPQTSK